MRATGTSCIGPLRPPTRCGARRRPIPGWAAWSCPALDPSQVFEGATAPPGGPHAEVTALARAGELHARGATLFTTLEPCAHHGRTPPCTDAIIAAGVARVVIGRRGPGPAGGRAGGGGAAGGRD